ncbi:MAG: hypothetical protein BKP49_01325 [Treponema sp. CETP13]|nr:MAG: hypothetical protein BKP49_01325 [Treponema sp. CETP13]
MAIQPIDLQTMYASLEKLSKDATFQKQGMQLHDSMSEEVKTKKNAEQSQTVKKTEDQENTQTVKERKDSQNSQGHNNMPQKEEKKVTTPTKETEKEYEQITDPSLGRRIDVSG